jgi:hypothetical protein
MSTDNVFSIDIEALTIDDIETIEEMTGAPIDKLGDPTMPKGKMLRALAFVKARKTDPTATPESVGGLRIEIATDKVGKQEANES